MKNALSLVFCLVLSLSMSLLGRGVDQEYLSQMEVEGWVLCPDQIRGLFVEGAPPPVQRTNWEITMKHDQSFYVLKIRNRGDRYVSGKLCWSLILESGGEWTPSMVTFDLPPHSPQGNEYYVLPGGLLGLGDCDKLPIFKFEWIELRTKEGN